MVTVNVCVSGARPQRLMSLSTAKAAPTLTPAAPETEICAPAAASARR